MQSSATPTQMPLTFECCSAGTLLEQGSRVLHQLRCHLHSSAALQALCWYRSVVCCTISGAINTRVLLCYHFAGTVQSCAAPTLVPSTLECCSASTLLVQVSRVLHQLRCHQHSTAALLALCWYSAVVCCTNSGAINTRVLLSWHFAGTVLNRCQH